MEFLQICLSKSAAKHRPFSCRLRYFSKKSVPKGKKYSHTLNLPVTKFQRWVKERALTDQSIFANYGFSELYKAQQSFSSRPEFILHDGPPYANGDVHMGHAINKILKDVINRRKLLEGFKVHYIPGWDCHGLPIELKALEQVTEANLSSLEIRKTARKFAEETIGKQRKSFESWGVMADWDSSYYCTFDKRYTQNQLHLFYTLYEKGLIFRGLKPVYWSPSSRTALAEAELEYNDAHTSSSVFLRLQLCALPETLASLIGIKKAYGMIWTTTPWTLPANKAIAFNPALEYAFISFSDDSSSVYLVATSLIKSLEEKLKKPIQIVAQFSGESLSLITYQHPLNPDLIQPFIQATHVTADRGTGLVHTAPAHGPEDFLLAIQHKISIDTMVDEAGLYTTEAGDNLEGLSIFSDGLEKVKEILQADILLEEPFVHSYPYDWRTKQPIIIRASNQWFIDVEKIKQDAKDCLKSVSMTGISRLQDLEAMIEKRPYWCISRQRLWGVPIPVLYNSTTNKPIVSKSLIDHYCSLIQKVGADFWWTVPTSELIPQNVLEDLNLNENEIERGKDILDIWFDSGISWSCVLGNEKVADVYLEGVDQLTGWFQSSLLLSVAVRKEAPFKSIFVHGYAVDKNGQKMSKSLGNIVNPLDIIAGGSDLKSQPAYGTDVLRWWVAAHSVFNSNIRVSSSVLQTSKDDVQEIRAIMTFLLGTVSDFSLNNLSKDMPLLTIDKYMLDRSKEFLDEIQGIYEKYQFGLVCRTVINFIANDVSSFYCHLTKDRSYCDQKDSTSRRACQFTMAAILESLLFSIAPILPHLTEEVYSHYAKPGSGFYFTSQRNFDFKEWQYPEARKKLDLLLNVKQVLLNNLPTSKKVTECDLNVNASPEVYKILQTITEIEMIEVLQVASVNISQDDALLEAFTVRVEPTANHFCERCRRHASSSSDSLCLRCAHVVQSFT